MDWEGVNTFVQRLYTSPPPSPWRSQSIGIFSESDTCRSCLFNIILGKVYMYIWSTCNNIQHTRYASDNILYQRQTSVWYTSTYPEMLYFLWIKKYFCKQRKFTSIKNWSTNQFFIHLDMMLSFTRELSTWLVKSCPCIKLRKRKSCS